MRIAYLSDYSPHDIRIWSGTPYHVFRSLQRKHDVVWLGSGIIKGALWHHRMLFKKNTFHPEDYTKEIGKILSEQISTGNFDAVITCTYHFCCDLCVDIPVIFYSDVTFDLFKAFVKNREIYYHKLVLDTEQRCLNNVDGIVYASEWAKQNAITRYKIPNNKVHVIEFGAGIPSIFSAVNIRKCNRKVCNLLFVGRNWKIKGGQIALNAYMVLKKRGFACSLTIIGCTPPEDIKDESVTIIPWIDKSNTDELGIYMSILKKTHFMVLPTRYDAFGIVLCEASAFGVPSITTDVCGVGQPIRNNINGILLPFEAGPDEYADKIQDTYTNKKFYTELSRNAIKEYNDRLNWRVWEERVSLLLDLLYKEKIKNMFFIPVYAINIPSRKDRLKHLRQQFNGKSEFELTYVEAIEHPIGTIGLWESIKKVVRLAINRQEDLIIICEDDHTFTNHYNRNYFMSNLVDAFMNGAEIFSGGIGGFGHAVPTATHRFKIDWFYCTQFIAISKIMYPKILEFDFKNTDTADGVLSVLSNKIQTIYPFISTQKDFGYSDVTPSNAQYRGLIESYFRKASNRLFSINEQFQRKQE